MIFAQYYLPILSASANKKVGATAGKMKRAEWENAFMDGMKDAALMVVDSGSFHLYPTQDSEVNLPVPFCLRNL